MQAKTLLIEQLSFEAQVKAREEISMYEEQIAEMKDKLDRKEFFMQNKERKWLEIEKILEEYVHEDDELRDRLLELRVNVSAANTKKISNVVQENDKLKVELDNAHEEIARMRKQLLTIGTRKSENNNNCIDIEAFTRNQGLVTEIEHKEEDDDEVDDDNDEEEEYEEEEADEIDTVA